MAFKVGDKQRTIINDNLDVNLNYIDSINDVRIEGGKIILDLSKGNLFRLPDLGGNTEREYDVYNGGYYNQGTYDSDNEFNRNGIASTIGRNTLFNDHTYEQQITFENYPPEGEVRKVSLLANYNPISSSAPGSNLQYFFQLLDFSTIVDPTDMYSMDLSSNGKYMLNTSAGDDGLNTKIWFRTLEKTYDLSTHDSSRYGWREFPAQTGDAGLQTFKFYGFMFDSSDASSISTSYPDIWWNGDGSAVYFNNRASQTISKFTLTKKWKFNTLDKSSKVDIDVTPWTSNTSPLLMRPRFAANGKYLFAMDFGLTGTGSDAYGIQRFTLETPYDIETIVDSKWKQLGNGTGIDLTRRPFGIDFSGERLWRGRPGTGYGNEHLTHTFLGEPFDIDELSGGTPYDYPGSYDQSLARNVTDVTNFQICGPKNDWLLLSDQYSAYGSIYTRLYLLGTSSIPMSGNQANTYDWDVSMADHWTFDDKILVDSSHMWGFRDKQNWGGYTWGGDSTNQLSKYNYKLLIESDGYGLPYNYESFLDGSFVTRYPAPDWRGNPNNKIRYVRPGAVDYFEFLVMDSSKGAILTNHVSGRRNNMTAFPQSGEIIYNRPGIYNFTVPEGVTYITAYCVGGGEGGGSGTQVIRNRLGDAKVGTGGLGGDGAYSSVTNFSTSGGTGYTIVVGAGGEAPPDTDSNLSGDTLNGGSNSYITTSLFFGTIKARAKGGGQTSSGNTGSYSAGGFGGNRATYTETLNSTDDPDSAGEVIYMGIPGGGGGAGGWGYNPGTFDGAGGNGSTGNFGQNGNIYGNDYGRGGGGGGGCPNNYFMDAANQWQPRLAGNGGGIYPYGPMYIDEHPTPNTRRLVNGKEGLGAFSQAGNPYGYDAEDGGRGSWVRGTAKSQDYGGGGAGNAFRAWRPNTGSWVGQDSRVYGGSAGGGGCVRIIWGNENQSSAYARANSSAGTGSLETQTRPSAFHTGSHWTGSHIIIYNPKEINHWG